MDSTIITAVAAAGGSLVGAAVTSVTTWITQRMQRVHSEREEKVRNREALYGEFIAEASPGDTAGTSAWWATARHHQVG